MKILVLGKSGQLGCDLEKLLSQAHDVTAVGRPDIDLTHPKTITTIIHTLRPRIIINAAAYTAVDKAESEVDLAMKINGEAPAIIAEEAKKLGAFLIHYSTDYVYDGTLNRPYIETDLTNPLSAYGRSKLAGDNAIIASGVDHLILRTSWVYADRGKNFLLTMLKLANERDSLNIVNDQWGAPTTSYALAEATLHLLPKARGLYHVTASGETTWHGFASAIFEATNKKITLNPISTDQYPTPATRPKNSRLNQDKLFKDFGFTMPYWQDELKRLLHQKN